MEALSPGAYHHTDTVIVWCVLSALAAAVAVETVRIARKRGKRRRDWLLVLVGVGVVAGLGIGTLVAGEPERVRLDPVDVAAPTPGATASR